MKHFFYCWLLLLLMGFASCKTNINPSLIIARQGQMDLSNWDTTGELELSLDGEWAFYGQQLLSPADFKQPNRLSVAGYAVVPGNWNGLKVAQPGSRSTDTVDFKMAGAGYATYRLVIIRQPLKQLAALRIREVNTAYRLWVNDEYLGGNGTVSTNPDLAVPQVFPQMKFFSLPSGDTLQIVLQVSNFSHTKGGLRSSIDFGAADTVFQSRDEARVAELWLAGAMFILFIYHLLIFLLRRKEYASLWFSLLCLDSTVRNLVTGERIFNTTFPAFPYAASMRIEYLTVTMGVPLYVLLAYAFFRKEWSVSVRNIILVICGLEFLLICFFPVRVFTSFLPSIQLIVLLECIYLIVMVIRAMIQQREFAVISFVSYCLCFAGIVHDILVAQLIINSPFIIFYTFSGFLLMQAYILAYRNSSAYKKIAALSDELNESNINLEKKVVQRTQDLHFSNQLLSAEKTKSDELLRNILPAEIADELRETGTSRARRYPSVTVMFTDFKDFTQVSEALTPEQLVKEIDYCYRHFDTVIEQYGLEKIKTMGDAYICAGGLPAMNFTHPEDVVLAALAIRDFMDGYQQRKVSDGEPFFSIRIGVHTGPVVAGIVGSKKFAYDIWGDTVNLAARMESSGEVNRVNISAATYQMIKDKFSCTHRGKIEAKHKGTVDMYFAERK